VGAPNLIEQGALSSLEARARRRDGLQCALQIGPPSFDFGLRFRERLAVDAGKANLGERALE
jgi:hypothetical protein